MKATIHALVLLSTLCSLSCRSHHDQRPGSSQADANTQTGSQEAPLEFEALSTKASLTKVKTLLTGLAPSEEEFKTATANPNSLGNLVDQWMKLDNYRNIMERFFANAFQQSQLAANDFAGAIDDGETKPNLLLLENLRQGFAKTVTALTQENRSFQEVATTHKFMMTTAMMMYYAYSDTSMRADATADTAGDRIDRHTAEEPNWSFRLTSKSSIPYEESVDPTSPNYMTFTVSDLADHFSKVATPKDDGPHCSLIDPIVYDNSLSFGGSQRLSHWLYSVITGDNFNFFDQKNGPSRILCRGKPHASFVLTDRDYNDWRMVSVEHVTANDKQSRFYDVPGLRKANVLKLYTPRVGYFTTPAFFAQYNTNVSNQARGIINQTMIVGLGHNFDGANGVAGVDAPGADPLHASKASCAACHASLDPMKRFFRSNYSLSFNAQLDPTQSSIPATFIFDDLVASGSSMDDLGRLISTHPGFKIAWAKKLCSYANSGECLESDPELRRIAEIFASSNYNWDTLVREIFTSPIVTFASKTASSEALGGSTPLTRRSQLCAILDSRLGFQDICGFAVTQTGKGGKSIPSLAAQLPADQYSRGQRSATYIGIPDPFYLSSVEKICALVADRVVDSNVASRLTFSSNDPQAAIASIVGDFMGIDSARAQTPIQILTQSYQENLASGATASNALKSTFTTACLSPAITSITQ
jgi:hypothetical protein